MTNAMTVCKMDLLSVRPYMTIKNGLFFVLFSLVFTFVTRIYYFPAVFAMTYALMFSSYPFLLGDESGTERLYHMMGIKSSFIVGGRYLYGIVVYIVVALGAFIIVNGLHLVREGTPMVAETAMLAAAYLVVYVVILAFNVPIYFNFGYKRAKQVATYSLLLVTFLIIGGSGFLLTAFPDSIKILFLWSIDHLIPIIFGGMVILCLLTMLSYQIALRQFKKRDL